jgi:hypothetical protein
LELSTAVVCSRDIKIQHHPLIFASRRIVTAYFASSAGTSGVFGASICLSVYSDTYRQNHIQITEHIDLIHVMLSLKSARRLNKCENTPFIIAGNTNRDICEEGNPYPIDKITEAYRLVRVTCNVVTDISKDLPSDRIYTSCPISGDVLTKNIESNHMAISIQVKI